MGRVRLSGGRASEGARRGGGGGRRRRGGVQGCPARAGAVEQRGEGSRGHTVQRASRRGARALPAGPRVRRAPGALRGPRHLPREHPAPRHTRPSSRAIIIIAIVIVIPPRGGVVGEEHAPLPLGLALALGLGGLWRSAASKYYLVGCTSVGLGWYLLRRQLLLHSRGRTRGPRPVRTRSSSSSKRRRNHRRSLKPKRRKRRPRRRTSRCPLLPLAEVRSSICG